MNKKIVIAIDAMGGDNSPDKTIHGVSLFLSKYVNQDDFLINLYGDKKKLKKKLINIKLSRILLKL